MQRHYLKGDIMLFFGKLKPFKDKNGRVLADSVSEKVFVNINDIRQGMFVKSKDAKNPVLLYLHGGMPEYFLNQRYPTCLEDYFYGCLVGTTWLRSFLQPQHSTGNNDTGPNGFDTIELTNYLRNRFGKQKIYLMAHSGGTFIGIHAVAKSPELYYAYIGVAQMCNQLKSEILAYEYMLEKFRKNGNKKMARELEAAPVTLTAGTPKSYLKLRDKAMHSLGVGTTHDMKSVVTGLFFPSLANVEYSLQEKINIWRGKASAGVSSLWPEMLSTDLSTQLLDFRLPVYFFEGIYDYTCCCGLAKDYFEKLTGTTRKQLKF